MTSLKDRWRSPAGCQRSGPLLLAAGVSSGGVTMTDRQLPSCVARLAGLMTSSVSVQGSHLAGSHGLAIGGSGGEPR